MPGEPTALDPGFGGAYGRGGVRQGRAALRLRAGRMLRVYDDQGTKQREETHRWPIPFKLGIPGLTVAQQPAHVIMVPLLENTKCK